MNIPDAVHDEVNRVAEIVNGTGQTIYRIHNVHIRFNICLELPVFYTDQIYDHIWPGAGYSSNHEHNAGSN